MANQVFSLSLALSVSSPAAGSAGAVLQLPNGFSVVGAPIPSNPVLTRDDPALLGLYTAEPGHYLASWSVLGDPSLLTATNWSLVVRAPSQAGPFTVKVALAGQPPTQAWQPSSPVGVTDFASITAAPNARVVTVVTVPSTDFEADTLGLPFGAFQQPPRYGVVLHDLDGDGDDDLATPGRAFLRVGDQWVESSAGLFVPVPNVNSLRIAAGTSTATASPISSTATVACSSATVAAPGLRCRSSRVPCRRRVSASAISMAMVVMTSCWPPATRTICVPTGAMPIARSRWPAVACRRRLRRQRMTC